MKHERKDINSDGVPRALLAILDYLMTNAVRVEGIFVKEGNSENVERLKSLYNNGTVPLPATIFAYLVKQDCHHR